MHTGSKKHETPTDANDVLTEVVSWGKDKILNLLLEKRGYLMSWDYNSRFCSRTNVNDSDDLVLPRCFM
jgi:hypothetical protein